MSKISSVNVLSRDKAHSLVFQPSKNLNDNQVMRIERYLDAVRSNLLFAKGVILVEGDAEQILIPTMFRQVFGISLDEIGISLINIGSTGFENIARIFHQDRIKRKCAILTDLDKAFIELADDSKQDTDVQKKARASQKSGEERATKLTDFCSNNKVLKPFFAEHTFEVDLIQCENQDLFEKTLPIIYEREADISKSKAKLKNQDIAISGTEILRLANKEGKGWFALLLADKVIINTKIPDYILQAIAWASGGFSISAMRKSAEYRLQFVYDEIAHHAIKDGESPEEFWNWEIDMELEDDVFLQHYRDDILLDEDPLTQILDLTDEYR